MFKSRASVLGSEAGRRAESGDYYAAIDGYSKAIALYPLDHRFYLNRALCYLKSELYHLALSDADEAIRQQSTLDTTCHLYRARALAGLQEYTSAELAYKQALAINDQCRDDMNESDKPVDIGCGYIVQDELIALRYRALFDIGFDKQTARDGSRRYPSIRAAIDGLLSERVFKNDISFNLFNNNNYSGEDITIAAINNDIELNNALNTDLSTTVKTTDPQVIQLISDNSLGDGDSDSSRNNGQKSGVKYADKARNWAKSDTKPVPNQVLALKKSVATKCTEKPTNIWGYFGLRVKNINSNNRKTIAKKFGTFGKVRHVEPVAKSKSSVWIYFNNPVSPVEAIAKMQNTIQSDLNYCQNGRQLPLRIFFAPTDEQTELRFSRPKQPQDPQGECYYWRTTTCLLGTRCAYSHVAANRQIDAQVWMKDREGKAI